MFKLREREDYHKNSSGESKVYSPCEGRNPKLLLASHPPPLPPSPNFFPFCKWSPVPWQISIRPPIFWAPISPAPKTSILKSFVPLYRDIFQPLDCVVFLFKVLNFQRLENPLATEAQKFSTRKILPPNFLGPISSAPKTSIPKTPVPLYREVFQPLDCVCVLYKV